VDDYHLFIGKFADINGDIRIRTGNTPGTTEPCVLLGRRTTSFQLTTIRWLIRWRYYPQPRSQPWCHHRKSEDI